MRSWKQGGLNELTSVGRTIIQHHILKTYMTKNSEQFPHSFAKLMFQGKTKAVLRLLSSRESGKPLHLDELIDRGDLELMKVRGILVDKHPPSKPADPDFIVDEEPSEVHQVVFDSLDASCSRPGALRTEGTAGSLGLDAQVG